MVVFGTEIRNIEALDGILCEGNFDTKINIRSNDEIGYLAGSFNYMATELSTLEEDQRKFIANVSHDFRSPLTSIKGYIEAIMDGTIPHEMQDKYLNIILFETERLNKLTQSMLELNKYGTKGSIMDITSFDINHTIKMVVQSFEGTCKQKKISFELILTGEESFVSADISKIQQVLYNLIDNAIKFSHPGSSITIETTEKNDKVFISVKDALEQQAEMMIQAELNMMGITAAIPDLSCLAMPEAASGTTAEAVAVDIVV